MRTHKALAVFSIVFLSTIPAFARPHDVYPVSCSVLWTAVKDTLENPRNYGIVAMNEALERATFVVVGDLAMYTDRVTLTTQGDGCAMKLEMFQVGSDNSDERGFRGRLKRSMIRLQTAKPAKEANSKSDSSGS